MNEDESGLTGCFTGKKALVVGGSGGIGAQLARLLARSGATLTVHGGSRSPRFDALLDDLTAISADFARADSSAPSSKLVHGDDGVIMSAGASATGDGTAAQTTVALGANDACVLSEVMHHAISCEAHLAVTPCLKSRALPVCGDVTMPAARTAAAISAPSSATVTALVQRITVENFATLAETPLARAVAESDVLCICYGPFLQKSLDVMTVQDWQDMAVLNYALPGFLVSAALGGMMERHWGRILLFGGTGTASRSEFRTNVAYAGAKTAVGTLVQSTAAAYARFGITCNAVLPGFTQTEYTGAQAEALAQQMPLGTLITAEAVARAAFFLLRSPDINGALLRLDRGWSPAFCDFPYQ